MGRLADATMNQVLDLIFGSGHASMFPASYDIALSTTKPTNAGANVTEPASGGYAAAVVANDDTHWPPASGRQQANGLEIDFPQPTAAWTDGSNNPIGYFAIYDHGVARSPSSFRAWAQLQQAMWVDATSAPPLFLPGTLVIPAPGT